MNPATEEETGYDATNVTLGALASVDANEEPFAGIA